MISNLEHAGEFLLQGWVLHESDPGIPVSVDVHINRSLIARIPAHTFRSDLEAAGYGSGHHAFFFNPFAYLTRRENLIEVRETASSTLVANGSRIVKTELATNRAAYRASYLQAQSHWTSPHSNIQPPGSEVAFLDWLESTVHFHPALRILEIGAGSGDLLKGMVERKKYFSFYLGLDLSRANVDALQARFGSDRIRFLTGDAARYPFLDSFDLIVASSVGSALFPSFLPAFRNSCRALAPGGVIVFDLVIQDKQASISRAEWRDGQWLRLYSQLELRRLLTEAGLELLQTQPYAKSANEHAIFINALKFDTQSRNRFEKL